MLTYLLVLSLSKERMSKKLLIATHNPGKLGEYKLLLEDLNLQLFSLKDLKIEKEAKEDGKTYRENAIKKARFYSGLTALPVLADDGGLEIDCLKGEPGLKSRRWPGHEASDEELIELALAKLRGVPWPKRGAQFRVVVALTVPGKTPLTVEGIKRGVILKEPRGTLIRGYPFRSIFYLPEFDKTFNQLSFEEEARIGHRRKALNKLTPFLKELEGDE